MSRVPKRRRRKSIAVPEERVIKQDQLLQTAFSKWDKILGKMPSNLSYSGDNSMRLGGGADEVATVSEENEAQTSASEAEEISETPGIIITEIASTSDLEPQESIGDKKVDEMLDYIIQHIQEAGKVLASLSGNHEQDLKLMLANLMTRLQAEVETVESQLDGANNGLSDLRKQLLAQNNELRAQLAESERQNAVYKKAIADSEVKVTTGTDVSRSMADLGSASSNDPHLPRSTHPQDAEVSRIGGQRISMKGMGTSSEMSSRLPPGSQLQTDGSVILPSGAVVPPSAVPLLEIPGSVHSVLQHGLQSDDPALRSATVAGTPSVASLGGVATVGATGTPHGGGTGSTPHGGAIGRAIDGGAIGDIARPGAVNGFEGIASVGAIGDIAVARNSGGLGGLAGVGGSGVVAGIGNVDNTGGFGGTSSPSGIGGMARVGGNGGGGAGFVVDGGSGRAVGDDGAAGGLGAHGTYGSFGRVGGTGAAPGVMDPSIPTVQSPGWGQQYQMPVNAEANTIAELEAEVVRLRRENERIIRESADYENAVQRALLKGVSSLNIEALKVLKNSPIGCCIPCSPCNPPTTSTTTIDMPTVKATDKSCVPQCDKSIPTGMSKFDVFLRQKSEDKREASRSSKKPGLSICYPLADNRKCSPASTVLLLPQEAAHSNIPCFNLPRPSTRSNSPEPKSAYPNEKYQRTLTSRDRNFYPAKGLRSGNQTCFGLNRDNSRGFSNYLDIFTITGKRDNQESKRCEPCNRFRRIRDD